MEEVLVGRMLRFINSSHYSLQQIYAQYVSNIYSLAFKACRSNVIRFSQHTEPLKPSAKNAYDYSKVQSCTLARDMALEAAVLYKKLT